MAARGSCSSSPASARPGSAMTLSSESSSQRLARRRRSSLFATWSVMPMRKLRKADGSRSGSNRRQEGVLYAVLDVDRAEHATQGIKANERA